MSFRAAWTLNDGLSAASATAPGTIPATVQAGDVLAVVAVENTGTATYTIAGGGTGVTWHLRSGPDDNSNAQRTYVWTAVASASSAGATVTVTSTVSSRLIGAGFAASGVTESSILIALTTDTTSDTSLVWPSVTIPSGGSVWELYSLATMRASTVPNLTTPPSGTVRDAKAATAFGSTPQFCALALHQTAQTPAGSGATSFGTATADIAVTNNLYTIAFQTTSSTVSGTLAALAVATVSLSGLLTIPVGVLLAASATASATALLVKAGVLNATATAAATLAGQDTTSATLTAGAPAASSLGGTGETSSTLTAAATGSAVLSSGASGTLAAEAVATAVLAGLDEITALAQAQAVASMTLAMTVPSHTYLLAVAQPAGLTAALAATRALAAAPASNGISTATIQPAALTAAVQTT